MTHIEAGKIFTIMVDRIEGEYAVSEFPDGIVYEPGIKLDVFPCAVKEKARYKMYYDENGEIKFVSKVEEPTLKRKRRIHSKFIRFS